MIFCILLQPLPAVVTQFSVKILSQKRAITLESASHKIKARHHQKIFETVITTGTSLKKIPREILQNVRDIFSISHSSEKPSI